MYWHKDSLW